jgi:adenine-specific DNA-methyltransferase
LKPIEVTDPLAHSVDLTAEKIDQLRQFFPEAITEDASGRRVDFDALRVLLGDAVSESDEKYGLNWHGKRAARRLALTPSTGTLRPLPGDSVDWETTQNLMIEGDNLEVLKLLQKSYSAKVKMIYIDPPYNTGKDFVYKDDFKDSIGNYLRQTNQVDESGAKTSTNSETSGRFHTDWLNMIYPRLVLGRNLLKDDGVLFISIDDSEVDNLRKICDETFGEENFLAQLFWEKGRKNDAKLFSTGHDYIVVYAKSKAKLSELGTKWRESKAGAAEIQAEYLRLREIYADDLPKVQEELRNFYTALPKAHPSKKHSRYSNVDKRGVWRDDNMSWPGGGGPTYDLPHPVTGIACAVPEGGWRYSTLEKMLEMIEKGKVDFRKDHTEPPIRKTYLVRGEEDNGELEDDDEDDLAIQVAGTYFYRSALQASNLMLELFEKKIFDNPKDFEVLMRWIAYVSDENAIVLDFFAGSGTTAHAVMALNALRRSTRKYILVQLPQELRADDKNQKVAYDFLESIGKPCNLAELTKERLRRSCKKIKADNPDFSGDLGFRSFKLDQTSVRPWNPISPVTEETLPGLVENILPGRSEEDLLYELLIKRGLALTVQIDSKTIASKQVYAAGAGTLIACLDSSIAASDVESLAEGIIKWHQELAPTPTTNPTTPKAKPAKFESPLVVFRDNAFVDDVAKSNLTEILKQHGLTDVRSL